MKQTKKRESACADTAFMIEMYRTNEEARQRRSRELRERERQARERQLSRIERMLRGGSR